ncbi:hypothetical protein SPRG_13404 [Saprolegnia parasitica CBS 223.65]|uniref:Uncharacterized protein n=1 Tax=Saprolegnia parasitica (strain CBS 223.65) TaxID=695850 RepID=A0A067C276_SAPPC|nr:hypothetical protein SPRG_13404 [Saprolegnia parasitica CBS 223.65]KDO20651.1 hypothetical protein SPRG_13404 [Saprolegnia parasitica CBS 223.65]|eukprot:XP_012208617.1 hypothetical protein SPRG_13404 [Saprolegnia parasitica CBS 223.65]
MPLALRRALVETAALPLSVVLGCVLAGLLVLLACLVCYHYGYCFRRRPATSSLHKPSAKKARDTEPTVMNNDGRDSIFFILGDTNTAAMAMAVTDTDSSDADAVELWSSENRSTNRSTDFFFAPPSGHESIGCNVAVDIYGSSWGSASGRSSYTLSEESVLYLESRRSMDDDCISEGAMDSSEY